MKQFTLASLLIKHKQFECKGVDLSIFDQIETELLEITRGSSEFLRAKFKSLEDAAGKGKPGKKCTNVKRKVSFKKELLPLSCDICGKVCTSKGNLLRHSRVHTEEKPFSCEFCVKRFSQKSNLEQHTRKHTGGVCGKRFSVKSMSKLHEKTHENVFEPMKIKKEKPSSSEKDFKTQLVKQEMIFTSKESPFVCAFCAKPFSYKSSLIRHERLHTGEKPYPCGLCGKQYSDSSARCKHERICNERSKKSEKKTL